MCWNLARACKKSSKKRERLFEPIESQHEAKYYNSNVSIPADKPEMSKKKKQKKKTSVLLTCNWQKVSQWPKTFKKKDKEEVLR